MTSINNQEDVIPECLDLYPDTGLRGRISICLNSFISVTVNILCLLICSSLKREDAVLLRYFMSLLFYSNRLHLLLFKPPLGGSEATRNTTENN